MFQIAHHRETEDGIHIISFGVEGETAAGQQAISDFFGSDFTQSTAKGTKIIVDMTNVPTLDSFSLSPLVQRLRDLQGKKGRLILCGVNAPALKEVFALTRFDQIFEITETVEDAIRNITLDLNDAFDDFLA